MFNLSIRKKSLQTFSIEQAKTKSKVITLANDRLYFRRNFFDTASMFLLALD